MLYPPPSQIADCGLSSVAYLRTSYFVLYISTHFCWQRNAVEILLLLLSNFQCVVVVCIAAIEDSKMYSNASDHTISSNLQRTSDSPRYQVHHTCSSLMTVPYTPLTRLLKIIYFWLIECRHWKIWYLHEHIHWLTPVAGQAGQQIPCSVKCHILPYSH